MTFHLTFGEFLDFRAEHRPPADGPLSSQAEAEQTVFVWLYRRFHRCFGARPAATDVLSVPRCPCPDHVPKAFTDRNDWHLFFQTFAKKRRKDIPVGTIGGPKSKRGIVVAGLDDASVAEIGRIERRASMEDPRSPAELSQAMALVDRLENSLDQFDIGVRDGREIQVAMRRALADIVAGDRAPANDRADRKATGFVQLTRDHLQDLLGEVVAGDGVAERAARSRRLRRGMPHVEAFIAEYWNDLGDGGPPNED